MSYDDIINILAEKMGILPEFFAEGKLYTTSIETKKALLTSLKVDISSEKKAKQSLEKMKEDEFSRALPYVVVARYENETVDIPVNIKKSVCKKKTSYLITFEDGEKYTQELDLDVLKTVKENEKFEQKILSLKIPKKLGYHTLSVFGQNFASQGKECSFIVVPQKCYQPEFMEQGGKPWGFPLQLYALHSENSQGIGDFSDLGKMGKIAASFGADILGINPVNVAFLSSVETASPYYSSTRQFLNPLYIDIFSVEHKGKHFDNLIKTSDFQKDLTCVRESKIVNYTAVGKLKMQALEALYADFKGDKDFDEFCIENGKSLENVALYQVLAENFALKNKNIGFLSWDKDFHDPNSETVANFAKEHSDRIMFFKYLFWIADRQLKKASDEVNIAGLKIGIYQDLAVGVASESSETWSNQDLFSVDLSIGSPPDMFNANGQSWGVAPMRPKEMKKEGYKTYRKILQANMKRAGAVRIDHAMGLARLFCIPKNEPGAYIMYPFSDIVGIVALESHRNKCLVIGEDLGVVPDFFREALHEAGILSFKVCRFEKNQDGSYIEPQNYPSSALAAAGTHDMPTLLGYWAEDDIKFSKTLGCFADEISYENATNSRKSDRKFLIEALSKQGLWFMDKKNFEKQITGGEIPPKMVEMVYRYLSTTSSKVFLVQLEDVLSQKEQMNVPGTTNEYPNWRIKLPVKLEDLKDNCSMKKICNIVNSSRI